MLSVHTEETTGRSRKKHAWSRGTDLPSQLFGRPRQKGYTLKAGLAYSKIKTRLSNLVDSKDRAEGHGGGGWKDGPAVQISQRA